MSTNFRVRQKQKNFMKNVDRIVYNTSPIPIPDSQDRSDILSDYRMMNKRLINLSKSSANIFSSPIPVRTSHISSSQITNPQIDVFESQPLISPVKTKTLNFLYSARENELKQPDSLRDRTVVQEFSSERLYRGARADRKHRSNKNPIYRIEHLEDEEKFKVIKSASVAQERKDLDSFLDSFRFLQNLKMDLQMNYQVARSEEIMSPAPGIGLFYQLEEALKSSINDHPKDLLKITRTDFQEKLAAYTTLIRELIRSEKQKGNDNEAIMIEMMWRLVTKLFDQAMIAHDYTINDAAEGIKMKIRQEIDTQREEMKKLERKWEEREEKLKDEIKTLTGQLNKLHQDYARVDNALIEKEIQLTELIEFESKGKTINSMKKMLKGLNNYISESEIEQLKQISTLQSISRVLELAEKLDQKPKSGDQSVQTLWSFSEPEVPGAPTPNDIIPSISSVIVK
ncbi:unnamed protein product [Blepharisma stoltei]|uniref:Translin-associated factor X-interacting protein 1 N-terminal domain-containing protein n=1 Tax=Blepharisma stoltei TaxID=1481888 RepID=A0AAU9K309_9CILI|nr:unnamed protein product [Blepharisma stoltei]